MNWQPFESAPKDETDIVLWCAGTESYITDCEWNGKYWGWWDNEGGL